MTPHHRQHPPGARHAERGLTRRGLFGLGAAALLGAGVYSTVAAPAKSVGANPAPGQDFGGSGDQPPDPGPSVDNPRLIGDGSTADTGPQPHQPAAPRPLEAGERPPQFVVVSWDGAAALDDGLFPRFRELAGELGAAMTFFLSGLYLLPEARREQYQPPRNQAGASDIGYLTDEHIRDTIEQLRAAWLEGHEIGTHFNGHFLAGSGSVGNWTPDDWRNEIAQAKAFVTQWRTNTGFDDLDPLPFDYETELVGGRTPGLLGQENLLPVAAELGWRYDASSPGGLQIWPERREGVWDLPLQTLPFPDHDFEVLAMDYSMLANQSGDTTQGDPAMHETWRRQATGAFLAGFERAYTSNRAPLFIGNHFEQWNGGIYMDAVEDSLREMAGHDEVRLVSFRQLCDWLDAQSPRVLANLRGLGVGQAPAGGWDMVVTG
ncbi:polysaccharide deacetylase family protein [Streptomyces millisiae]|uniref:Lipoprotein n=1 Tax=Streptomyces millisiae TaxID=3075542 RepID=A0ABU2LRM6_9ACTN|nr:hypothetical protein [Streptomyces sp. DSM 44918]MDT0320243.1 hypothetical protein [Streptomyces sp. DSM 44918]